MRRLRTVLFWCHLACGVTAGVVILIMCVTGVALTYQRQMQWWADTHTFRATPADGAERLPIADLLAAVERADPDALVTGVTLRADSTAPVAISSGARTVYVNPYTAEVYGEGTGASMRAFFQTMTSWHRYLAMSGESRTTGRAITGAANLFFLFVVLSGMYLWWPRSLTWTQVRNVIWFRRTETSKARDFNWHNVLGFWSALPLAIVVYSGVVISYPWASNMVYRVAGEEPPAAGRGRGAGPGGRGAGPGGRGAGPAQAGPSRGIRQAVEGAPRASVDVDRQGWSEPVTTSEPDVDLDAAIARAMAHEPAWNILTLRLPDDPGAPLTVAIDRGEGGQPQLRGTLTLDPQTLAVREWEGFDAQTPGRRARSILRFAHTGEVAGRTGQTIAGLVSAAGAVMVYTGLALSLRRFIAWRRRRAVARA